MTKDKDKAREYNRKYYNEKLKCNPLFLIKSRERAKIRNILVRREMKNFLLEYQLSHPCSCGESDVACLEFHHINNDKEIHISEIPARGWGMKRTLVELAKCIVMCANCHRKLHYTNPA